MKKFIIATVATFILISISGCSNMTVLRTQELREVQYKVDTLHSELTALQRKLLEEQKTNSEMLRLLRADQQVRFNEIDRKVSAIESNLFESHSRLSKIDQKTTEFTRRLEQKFASDEDAANSRKLEIQKLFEIAMSDFNAGRYDMAINGFQDLSNQFRDSPQAPEADYWIAESHYAKKDLETAERAYIEFIKKYPDGPRMCVSLYKLGLLYENQGKTKSKEMVWKNLLDRCKNSQEAKVVQTQLNSN